LVQFQPLSHRKRTALLGFIIFLLLVTGLTGILTFGADREFQRVTGDPYATDHQMKKAHIVFSICLSFLFFAVTLTLGLILLWLFIELFFYIQRRRVLQQAANRMAAELRRRQQAAQGTSL
jgi:membrane protein insertase Oxa1/YidC/SpoIIIJ